MKNLTPKEAYDFLLANRHAAFIDCRSDSEYYLVGHPTLPSVKADGSLDFGLDALWRPENIMYSDDMRAEMNDQFVTQASAYIGADKSRPVVISCRSGRRSVFAGKDLEAAGYSNVINLLHGFEGSLNDLDQRGKLNGWRFDGLPWEQL